MLEQRIGGFDFSLCVVMASVAKHVVVLQRMSLALSWRSIM